MIPKKPALGLDPRGTLHDSEVDTLAALACRVLSGRSLHWPPAAALARELSFAEQIAVAEFTASEAAALLGRRLN